MKLSCYAIPLLILAMSAMPSAQSKPRRPAVLAPVADCIQPLPALVRVEIQPLDPVTETGAQPPGERLLALEHEAGEGADADILPLDLVSIPLEVAPPAAAGEERPIKPLDLVRLPPAANDPDAAAALRPMQPLPPEPLPRVTGGPTGC